MSTGNWLNKVKLGFAKTTESITNGIRDIFLSGEQDSDKAILDRIEDFMISSDVGIDTSRLLIDKLAMNDDISFDSVVSQCRVEVRDLLSKRAGTLSLCDIASKPKIIMLSGVNGNGKTTTAAKLAYHYAVNEHCKVALVAADTFRAAAQEQLKIWADKIGCDIYGSELHAGDPAALVYKAIEKGNEREIDVLIIDTAGRLHSSDQFMKELKKINKVIKKHDETAPHRNILVLDATTGQNAIHQLKSFKNVVNIDGLILTKLDGTAKGGILIALAMSEPDVRIHAVCMGEGIDDIREFDPDRFAGCLFAEN